MKLKNRKIKYAAIFCLCWFVFLVILVDGVLKFKMLVDYFGSYVLVEITLLLLVILPTLAVYRLTKERKTMSKREYIQANKDWLEAKSKEEGVKALPKGLYYKVLAGLTSFATTNVFRRTSPRQWRYLKRCYNEYRIKSQRETSVSF